MRVREAMAARSQQSPGMGKSHVRPALPICARWCTRVPCWGETGSLGRAPLNLQKRPRNLGKPAPALIARARLGLQKGGAEAEQEGTGIGNYFGKTLKTPQGLPSAPWQISVRVAPSTMNWGFENSSCKRPRVLSLGQPLLETGTQVPQTPL